MGKGDKKSRRGKIIIGSTGVRRPKSSGHKVPVKDETTAAVVVGKVKKATDKPKADPKVKIQVPEMAAGMEAGTAGTPEKTVRKAVKKTAVADLPE